MDITIHKREKYGVVINRYGLEDPRLSFKAKGILAYLMTKPDGWQVNSTHLSKVGKDGRDAILKALDQLGEAGYFTRKCQQDKAGKWVWEQSIYDYPNPARAKSYRDWKNRLRKSPTVSEYKTLSSKGVSKGTHSFCRTCGVERGSDGCWHEATG